MYNENENVNNFEENNNVNAGYTSNEGGNSGQGSNNYESNYYSNPYESTTESSSSWQESEATQSGSPNEENGFSYQESFINPDAVEYGNNKNDGKNDKYLTKKFALTLVIICVVASFLFGIGGGILGGFISGGGSTMNLQTAASTTASQTSVTYTGEEMSADDVAAFAADSVVEVYTEQVQGTSFLQQYVTEGAGSGVIISENGYIATNNHVIEDASSIKVRTRDGNEYTAKVIGTDADSDVALIKVDATGLKAAVIGDSSVLKVGETAIAIGNPLGDLGGTVTKGIISALDRTVTVDGVDMTVLQTDASINPGNSGGGLFNSKGEFIGLVALKSQGDGVEGLGFAIPSNTVKPLLEELKKNGRVTGKPALGVTLVTIDSDSTAQQYGVSQQGVYVSSVDEDTAAAEAGIAVGDCITAVDGQKVSTSSEVTTIISSHKVSDKITLTILRNGKELSIEATLKEKNSSSSSSSSSNSKKNNSSSAQNNQGNQNGNSNDGSNGLSSGSEDLEDLFDYFGF